MKHINSLLLAVGLFITMEINAQQPSVTKSTEIWLVDITFKDADAHCGLIQKITSNEYYDNQPSFSPDGKKMYFASMPDSGQTDIMEYTLATKITKRLTNTPESEYQPQPIPGKKGFISVVRVNDEKVQGFYSINYDGTQFENIAESQDSLAYYAWMNDTTVGMYVLNGDQPSLEQFDMVPLQSIVIQEGGFGRCLQKIPGTDDLSFVMKNEKDDWGIFRFNFEKSDTSFIIKTMPGEEDYCWTPQGYLLMGSKGKLFLADPAKKEKGMWKEIADLKKNVGNFYRIAINPSGTKVAIVSYDGAKP